MNDHLTKTGIPRHTKEATPIQNKSSKIRDRVYIRMLINLSPVYLIANNFRSKYPPVIGQRQAIYAADRAHNIIEVPDDMRSAA